MSEADADRAVTDRTASNDRLKADLVAAREMLNALSEKPTND